MNDESWDHAPDKIEVPMSREELAAVEGWQQANQINSREAAIRQLVRLGLLSEIGRIYSENSAAENGT
ncbi:MAG: hypothetical protein AAGF56_10385 [Pseudomonadota bacterium]